MSSIIEKIDKEAADILSDLLSRITYVCKSLEDMKEEIEDIGRDIDFSFEKASELKNILEVNGVKSEK